MRWRLPCLLLLLGPVGGPAAQPPAAETMLMLGYGATYPGLSTPTVRTADLVLRRRSIRKMTGRDGYRGSHDLLVELSVSRFLEPPARPPIFAVNVLAAWTLWRWETCRPYLFVGGGPVYTEAGLEGMGAKLNGNYQAGAGLTFAPGSRFTWCVEYRFHHISNGGRKSDNDPLNTAKFMVGARFH